MKTILVTGGTGFIGSHTSLLLLEKGYEIFIIDSFENSSPKSLDKVLLILKKINIFAKDRIHLFECDLRIKDDIEKVFKKSLEIKKPIESVIHFAGLKSVSESNQSPLDYWENNVNGTINLLKVMKKYNCKNIVFSSSATVYLPEKELLIKETHDLGPVNPYGNTKLAIEKILNDLFKSEPSAWRIICLRYFNPIGADPSGLLGEDPMGKINNIYPQLVRVGLGELKEIKIFGNDWPTSDGTGIRDYIHIVDLANGHLSALNYIIKKSPQFLIINLGTGKGTSVLELIKTFEKVNKVKIPYRFVERREGDHCEVVADNSLAKSLLNWRPTLNLEDMCRDGWKYQLKN